jgi:transposase InsO family protein
MFWHVLLMLLSPFCLLASRLVRDDRDREILALRQQVRILQRQAAKRPQLTRGERLALLLACLGMKKRQLLDSLLIVRPATLVGWHREIVRRRWTFRCRRRPGRPKIDPAAEQLALRIARENPRMGYTKIAGEMRKLGFANFGRSTVGRILRRHGLAPRPNRRAELSWRQFLGHYRHFVWACDFFTVTTATLKTYYVLFFIEIATRRISFWNVSTSPDRQWVAQEFRNLAVVCDESPRFLIHDRDDKFTAHADGLLSAAGTRVILLPPRSPDLNGHAERRIRTLREECLDRIIILNERHLRWVLREFVRYYNRRRPHRTLRLRAPEARQRYPNRGEVARRRVLGGLTSDYYRLAA